MTRVSGALAKTRFYLWFETEFETELNLNSSLKPDFVDWNKNWAVIDLYEPVSDSILKPDLVSWYK